MENINKQFQNYSYPDTSVLKNKYGAVDFLQFEELCAHGVAKAMINLQNEPLPEKFDSSYLKYIHKRLFGNTFEWAGHTRDIPFKFSDGSVAWAPAMHKADSPLAFAINDDIQEGLQVVDYAINERNNLRGLSHKEFVEEATEIFTTLNYIHPFREGNGRTQRVFCEKLAQAAGHKLDFSLVTNKRMTDVSIAAMRNNLEPMQHMLEDISNPDKSRLLREFIDHTKSLKYGSVDYRYVSVAEENTTIMGNFIIAKNECFVIDTGDSLVICPKADIPKDQLEGLQPGDFMVFTSPKAPEILIPDKKMGPLPKGELSEMTAKDDCVQENIRQIKELSKIIYNNPTILDEKINQIRQNPSLAKELAQKIENDPESISKFAGKKHLIFKNQARKDAERHVSSLSTVIENHPDILKHTETKITQDYQKEQERKDKAIEAPDKDLKNFFSLSQEKQKDTLSQFPKLRQKFSDYAKKISDRLSPKEHKAIRDNDHQQLSKTVGVCIEKAKEIAEVVKLTKDIQKQIQTLKLDQSKQMAMAH
ncbi:BID domain-containing T4SS effector [Bartonella ancashensis]|uniref:protein adenylyltransferase n=1 Tax=Bartonella ancashensis TaxID=1318743 RepID=A0A0M3T2N3_9HYPH|nr:BID domain-containing T4SS effector [Bartonella ancashensis]ALE03035.1 hypothetical protein PU02_0221 [Bartonella ancashensis]ARE31036.1 Bep221 [Bartonella ancashensis]